MPYIKTRDGTDLYVKDWGAGRPVILTHGWPLNADSWDAQAMALANAGFRAIAEAEPARCVVVPSDDSPERVHALIWAAVSRRLSSP